VSCCTLLLRCLASQLNVQRWRAMLRFRTPSPSSNVSKCVPTGNLSDFENYIVSLDFFDATSSALVVRGNDLENYRDSIHSDKSTRNNPRPELQGWLVGERVLSCA
jgi:hypothetical protein